MSSYKDGVVLFVCLLNRMGDDDMNCTICERIEGAICFACADRMASNAVKMRGMLRRLVASGCKIVDPMNFHLTKCAYCGVTFPFRGEQPDHKEDCSWNVARKFLEQKEIADGRQGQQAATV